MNSIRKVIYSGWFYFEKWLSCPKIRLFKSIYFNLRTVGSIHALKLPLLLYGKVKLAGLGGKVVLPDKISFGMIKIGTNPDLLDSGRPSLIYLEPGSRIIFRGRCLIGCGSVLRLTVGSEVIFGDNCRLGTTVSILSESSVRIGEDTDLCHGTTVMDTNFHYMQDLLTGRIRPRTEKIVIGERNWITRDCMVMKGTVTLPDTTVAAGSRLHGDYSTLPLHFPLLGGNPAQLISEGKRYIRSVSEEAEIFRRQSVLKTENHKIGK